jgi:hypothetical protein
MPVSESRVAKLVGHILAAFNADIVKASEAIKNGELNVISSISAKLAASRPVGLLTDILTTSDADASEFYETVSSQGGVVGRQILKGGVLSGVGAGALIEAAGLAAALGVATITVQVVAVVMIVVGICIVLGAIWETYIKPVKWSEFLNI